MILAVPPGAAAARALDVAAAGGVAAAETQPPVTTTPAKAAMASTATNPSLSMANLLLRNDGFAATAGRRQWAVSGGPGCAVHARAAGSLERRGDRGHTWSERLLRVLVPVDVVGVDPGVSVGAGEALERERHDQVADPHAQRVADRLGSADAVGVGDDLLGPLTA